MIAVNFESPNEHEVGYCIPDTAWKQIRGSQPRLRGRMTGIQRLRRRCVIVLLKIGFISCWKVRCHSWILTYSDRVVTSSTESCSLGKKGLRWSQTDFLKEDVMVRFNHCAPPYLSATSDSNQKAGQVNCWHSRRWNPFHLCLSYGQLFAVFSQSLQNFCYCVC